MKLGLFWKLESEDVKHSSNGLVGIVMALLSTKACRCETTSKL